MTSQITDLISNLEVKIPTKLSQEAFFPQQHDVLFGILLIVGLDRIEKVLAESLKTWDLRDFDIVFVLCKTRN